MEEKSYTVPELVNNNSFRRMARGDAYPREIEQWSRWIEKSSRNRQIAKEALAEIAGFEFDDPDFPDLQHEWKKLYQNTAGRNEKLKAVDLHRKDRVLRWVFRAAAVILLVSSVGIGIYISNLNQNYKTEEVIVTSQTVTTGENEQKRIKLSDGSTIVLNANSSLTYYDGWDQGKTVRTKLQGEAFFHVIKRTSPNQPEFQVVTPDGLIRDMGTEFVVTVEEDRSRVVLQEGWVRVETNAPEDEEDRTMDVHVGEMLEFTKTDLMEIKQVNPTFYSSWATGALQFDYTPVKEFAQYVKQEFDVTVVIGDPGLRDKKINGAVYYRSLEELVRAVSKVLNVPVYRSAESDTVFIGINTNQQ